MVELRFSGDKRRLRVVSAAIVVAMLLNFLIEPLKLTESEQQDASQWRIPKPASRMEADAQNMLAIIHQSGLFGSRSLSSVLPMDAKKSNSDSATRGYRLVGVVQAGKQHIAHLVGPSDTLIRIEKDEVLATGEKVVSIDTQQVVLKDEKTGGLTTMNLYPSSHPDK